MKLLAMDPGGNTGFATAEEAPGGGWRHSAWYLPAGEAMAWLGGALASGEIDEVVSESITINAQTHKKSQDVLISVEQIGIARYLCHCHGVAFKTQRPYEAMSFANDGKLKAMGWWTKGPTDHPRAASRHLMTRLCAVDAAFRADVAARV